METRRKCQSDHTAPASAFCLSCPCRSEVRFGATHAGRGLSGSSVFCRFAVSFCSLQPPSTTGTSLSRSPHNKLPSPKLHLTACLISLHISSEKFAIDQPVFRNSWAMSGFRLPSSLAFFSSAPLYFSPFSAFRRTTSNDATYLMSEDDVVNGHPHSTTPHRFLSSAVGPSRRLGGNFRPRQGAGFLRSWPQRAFFGMGSSPLSLSKKKEGMAGRMGGALEAMLCLSLLPSRTFLDTSRLAAFSGRRLLRSKASPPWSRPGD